MILQIFKEKERKRGHSANCVKIITGSSIKVYSVRLRDRGPDYRGFVQLPLVQDEQGNFTNSCDPEILASASRCYVDTCSRNTHVGNIMETGNTCLQHWEWGWVITFGLCSHGNSFSASFLFGDTLW